jgi:hypothetical protein
MANKVEIFDLNDNLNALGDYVCFNPKLTKLVVRTTTPKNHYTLGPHALKFIRDDFLYFTCNCRYLERQEKFIGWDLKSLSKMDSCFSCCC